MVENKMKKRKSKVSRKSQETTISVELNVDGKGLSKIQTPIGFLNHMLQLFAFHGCFDLMIKVAKADTEIDIHHTNEDIAIVLGKAFAEALGTKTGIRRFGNAFAPMESTLGQAVIDICGRPHFTMIPSTDVKSSQGETYGMTYAKHFFESFAKGLEATINIQITNISHDLHTDLETAFKSLGLALGEAVQIDPRRKGMIPSTKGIID
jgi:imidazoleglycerol-phosphate dehydratase